MPDKDAVAKPAQPLDQGLRSDYAHLLPGLILTPAMIAATVLCGWLLHVEAMKRIAAGLTSMNPVTAVGIELACLNLWLLRNCRPLRGTARVLHQLLPLLLLFVGLTKLLDLLIGTSLCPDALLFKDQLDFGQAYPSRIAPNVAVSFVLMALALLAVDRPGWPRALHPQWLVTPILCAAMAALIGYAYDTSGFYAYRHYIPMALHTAFCLLLLSAALILCRPDQGYLRLIPRGSPGARNFSRLLLACVLAPATLGGLAQYLNDQGWISGRSTGTAIAIVLTIFTLVVFAFLISVSMNRVEAIRHAARLQLEDLIAQLSARNAELQGEIVERKRMEAAAEHLALHDPLTGLPNRRLFVDRLKIAMTRTLRHNEVFALFYLDIDEFKPINDRFGHQAGDALLQELAARLKAAMRACDSIARLGGDEFAAIMDSPLDEHDALRLAERVSVAVRRPYTLSIGEPATAVEATVGISVGVALFPSHARDLDTLISAADGAMYRAKSQGRSSGSRINIKLAAG